MKGLILFLRCLREIRRIRREQRRIRKAWKNFFREQRDEVIADYTDGRSKSQRHVVPIIIRPFGMWRWK